MDNLENFPLVFTQAQHSLAPYIRSRQEASHIRRVLAAHLDAQLDHKAGSSKLAPLSLANSSTTVKSPSATILGLRKDYLRSLRANIRARREYDRISSVNALGNGDSTSHQTGSTATPHYSVTCVPKSNDYLDSYLALIRQRQRQERLCILEDYINSLEHKSAAAVSYLEQATAGGSPLPRVPADIVTSSDVNLQESTETNLNGLLRDLEKSVLQAKIQFKSEKRLLEQVKVSRPVRQQAGLSSASRGVERLQALGRTRNELINWVEEELGKAGDTASEDNDGRCFRSASDSERSTDQQIATIKAQYGQYIQARKEFLDAVAETVTTDLVATLTDARETELEVHETENMSSATHTIAPYLGELLLISNEQKSLIQQKSHFTVSLAKQHKETVQAFDRLADESHLLPAFPLPASNASRRGYGEPGKDEMVGTEMPNASQRAHAWTYAADMASREMREAVTANVEEGNAAIEGARQLISTLEQLLGHRSGHVESNYTGTENAVPEEDIWMPDTTPNRPMEKILAPGNIWASLDGHLGVLKREYED